jgi:hypothetical protein
VKGGVPFGWARLPNGTATLPRLMVIHDFAGDWAEKRAEPGLEVRYDNGRATLQTNGSAIVLASNIKRAILALSSAKATPPFGSLAPPKVLSPFTFHPGERVTSPLHFSRPRRHHRRETALP